jgi:hypothetical protein
MIRRAKAVWRGTGQAGNGYLTSDSGGSPKPRIFIKTRFIPIRPLRKREGHKSTGLTLPPMPDAYHGARRSTAGPPATTPTGLSGGHLEQES